MIRPPELAVIGAGIVGASIARRLAERGLRVTVLEAKRPAGGTSLATFGWVNAVGKQPRGYFDLNVSGMAEHLALRDELDDGDWYHPGGNLEWSREADELASRVEHHRAWGYRVELVDAAAARDLEPDVVPPDDTVAAFYPDDAWIDVGPLVRRLLDHPGIRLMWPSKVIGLATAGPRVVGLRLADGRELTVDQVVVCAGPHTHEIAEWCGFALPMRRSPGLLATTEPGPIDVRRILHLPGLALRPDGAGRLLLANDGLDRQIELSGGSLPLADAAGELMRRAVEVVPRLAGVSIASQRVGQRALTADGRPAVGPIPGCDGVYLAVMHSGVTLGPYVARLAAGEIADGVADARLDDYRPDRFSDVAVPA